MIEVWLWDGSAEPVVVTNGLQDPRLVMVLDGYLYFSEGPDSLDRVIYRAQTERGVPAERLEWHSGTVDRVWATDSYLWWTRFVGPVSELWRRGRAPGSLDERVLTAMLGPFTESGANGPARWEIGNDELAIFQKGDDASFNVTPIPNGADRWLGTVGLGDVPSFVMVDNQYLLTTINTTCRLDRFDLATGGRKGLAQFTSSGWCEGSRTVVRRGPWVDWFVPIQPAARISDTRLVFGRSHIDITVPVQRLAEFPTADSSQQGYQITARMVVSPAGELLTYYHPDERRIFTLAVPPYSCSDALPCPNGLSCGADETCH